MSSHARTSPTHLTHNVCSVSRGLDPHVKKNLTHATIPRMEGPNAGEPTGPEATTAKPPTAPPRQKHKKASIAEQIAVLDLRLKGISQKEIARVTGFTQQAVSDIIARHEPTTNHALDVLKANSYKAAVDWVRSFNVAVKRGEHRPMRDALIATGVVAPDPQAQGITVIVGSGDVSISPSPQSIGAKVHPDSTHNPTLSLPNHDEAL